MSKSKDNLAQMQIHSEKYNFDIKIKVINVCDTSSHGDKTCAKYGMTMSKDWQKSYGPNTIPCQKPNKFDLDVKIISGSWIYILSWW